MRPTLLLAPLAFAFAAHATNLCNEALTQKLIADLQSRTHPDALDCNCLVMAAGKDDGPPKPKWKLFWSDGFDYTGKPDPKKWEYDLGGDGFGNNEDQYFTDSIKNAHVENGKLTLEARIEKMGEREYTSARLNSKQTFTYGRFVFRAKLPKGRGSWPAAWLIAKEKVYGDEYWPDNGEIDVIESVGHEPNVNHISTHSKDNNFILNSQHTATVEVPGGDEQFHEYTLDWLPNRMDFYVDGKKFSTLQRKRGESWRTWPFDQEMKIRMNLTVGGNWGNQQGIDKAAFPMKYEIESVKVYAPLDAADCAAGNTDAKLELNSK